MTQRPVDILVQIPLEEEFSNFLKIFPPKESLREGVHLAYQVDAPHGATVVAILQEKMGRSAAMAACRHALERFKPKIYICLGIGGGISSDLKIGDIAYTGTMIDILDNSKVIDSQDGDGVELGFEPDFYHTDRLLTANIGFIRTMPELSDIYTRWQNECMVFAETILPGGIPVGSNQKELHREAKTLNGTIICGAVGQSDNYKAKLKSVSRRLLALETESGSVFQECINKGIHVLAIRGISDYADSEKKKLEQQSKEAARQIAARNAATFLRAQLECNPFLEFILTDDEPSLSSPKPQYSGSNISDLLKRSSESIDEKLRQLSPHYKAKPVGFRLPPPRVRPIINAIDEKRLGRQIEILNALETFKRIVVNVPRTYPDPALPWAIAGHLISADIDGRKALPVVIDGRSIARPRSGLRALSPIDLPEDPHSLGAEIIFIVHGFDFSSKSRTSFLAAEMHDIAGARYLFVSDEDQDLAARLEQRKAITNHEFQVCEVSFNEIALFFEDAFSMPGREAEVLALEFQKLFRQFRLPSHPSFFAGIASDALSALLQANRRSELIQLAVDGALSFIVASDQDPIRLSRTTRSGFLRRLVFEQKVNRRTFTQAAIVEFAEQISDRFDYGINAVSFIDSFILNGIIHFDNGHATVTMPFIESYLLATELANRPNDAVSYFDPYSDNFDFLTFDIYAELGSDGAVLESVRKALAQAMSGLSVSVGEHILLGSSLKPKILRNPARLVALQKRVADAREAVESGRGSRDEKITVLDLAERVQEDVAQQQDVGESEEGRSLGKEIHDQLSRLNDLGRAWAIGTSLLGSGAEGLDGNERLQLASDVLLSSEALVHHWTKVTADVNFEEIKNTIKTEFGRAKVLTEAEEREFHNLVDSMVDFIEFVSLGNPFESTIDYLTDAAKNAVIGNSLKRVVPKSEMQRVILGLWLTHIDTPAGRRMLMSAINDIPKVQFFRSTLASWLVMRLKWKVPNRSTQLVLLDAAEDSIKPLNRGIDRGELLRLIERGDRSKVIADGPDNEE